MGDFAVLRYLHEEVGATLGPSVFVGAAYGGCEAMLEWLVGRAFGLEDERMRDRCYLHAGKHGDLCTLVCLRRLGVQWSGEMLMKAVDAGVPLPVLQWMWGQGARFSSAEELQEAARLAATQRDVKRGQPVAEWLLGLQLQGVDDERCGRVPFWRRSARQLIGRGGVQTGVAIGAMLILWRWWGAWLKNACRRSTA